MFSLARRFRSAPLAQVTELALRLLLVLGLPSPSPAQVASAYQVKAAFLYNFAKFATWPSERASERELYICIAGADPFGPEIDAIAGKRVGDRSIVVRRIEQLAAAGDCHMLFVSVLTEDPDRWIEGAPSGVLTVSEEGGEGRRTAMIHLLMLDKKIRFEIDRGAAERAGMELSSQLLQLAVKVKE